MNRKHFIVATLFSLVLLTMAFIPTSSQQAGDWVPIEVDPANFRIKNRVDDAHQLGSGAWYTTGTNVQIISHTDPSTMSYGGFLFQGVSLPNGATVHSANLSVYAYTAVYDDANLDIYGNDVDNAATFGSGTALKDRTRTTAKLSWVANSFGVGWKVLNVTVIVQEIVLRSGWSTNNNMSFLFIPRTDTIKMLYLRSYEGAYTYRAILDINYDVGLPVPEDIVNNLGKNLFASAFGGTAAYYAGASTAIYYAVLNATSTKFIAKAYNISTQTWTNNIVIGDAPHADPHYSPSISMFPNGSVVIFYGYTSDITYRYTTQSALVQKNQTSLLSSWSAETVMLIQYGASYSHAIFWNDRLLLFYRKGDSYSGQWAYKTFTTSWSSENVLVDEDTGEGVLFKSSYWYFNKYGDYIAASGYRYNDAGGNGHYEDALFLYSPNKGSNWYLYNGTSFTLPITPKKARVFDTAYGFQFTNSVLDANYSVSFFSKGDYWKTDTTNLWYVNVVYYSLQIGQSGGTWSWANVTDTSGVKLQGTKSAPFYDVYYQKPAFYLVNSTGYPNNYVSQSNVTKYIRYGSDPTKYSLLSTTDSKDTMFQFSEQNIVDAVAGTFFNVLTSEYTRNILGCEGTSGDKYNVTKFRVYATKFTATATTKIDAISVHVERATGWKAVINVAVYNDIGSVKLAQGNGHAGTTETGAHTAYNNWITVPLSSPLIINNGFSYWLALNGLSNITNEFLHYTSGSTNQSLYINRAYTDGFPQDLNLPSARMDTKIAIFGVVTQLRTRGSKLVGEIPPPPVIPQVSIEPAAITIPPDNFFSVQAKVENVTNLYSWQLELFYSNDIINAINATEGPFLNSSGPTTFLTALDNNYSPSYGRLVLAGSFLGANPGVNGSGILATIVFKAIAPGNSDLYAQGAGTMLLDPQGRQIAPISVKNGLISVSDWSTDLNGDRKVDIQDIAIVALAYGSYPGQSRWNPVADLNKDNNVDIRDLVLVAKHFGEANM